MTLNTYKPWAGISSSTSGAKDSANLTFSLCQTLAGKKKQSGDASPTFERLELIVFGPLLERIVKRLAGIFRSGILVNRLLQGIRNIVDDQAPVDRGQRYAGRQLCDKGLFPPVVFELRQVRDIFPGWINPFDPVRLRDELFAGQNLDEIPSGLSFPC